MGEKIFMKPTISHCLNVTGSIFSFFFSFVEHKIIVYKSLILHKSENEFYLIFSHEKTQNYIKNAKIIFKF